MSIEKLRPSFSFTEDRLKELQAVVPEAFADGKINWDVLREALGETLEDETQEHFGLSWPGKREARRLAAMPSEGTLVPVPGEGINEDTTHNIFIEGENLEVLKLLQKSYAGRVKMIYIDPPYNTGNDFVYSDDYSEPLDTYLSRTGAMDADGRMQTSNSRASGRYHSNWLNMMFPRLLVARSLLQDNGVIFVSIDDNEVQHLRNIMGEIFGDENFVAQIPWQSRLSVQNDTDISVNHEYIVIFAKARRMVEKRLKESNVDEWYTLPSFAVYPLPLDPERFSNPDNDPRGSWKADPFDAPNIRPNLTYAIINPLTGEEFWPPAGRHWRMEEEKYKALLADGRIIFGRTGSSRPQLKVFYEEKKEFGEIQTSWFNGENYGTTNNGTREIQDLFNGKAVFDTPKPTILLKALLRMATRENDLVLDFFAGSCSIAHAVFNQNEEDGCTRKFICVQLDEGVKENSLAYQEGFRKVSEIGRERIRRVIATKINRPTTSNHNADLGIRTFKLVKSHFKLWKTFSNSDISQMEMRFEQAQSPLIEGWGSNNLMVEILLMQGFFLDSRIIPLEAIQSNHIQRVHSDACDHELFVCLDAEIRPETLPYLHLRDQDAFICLDTALTDQLKALLADTFNLKVI